jgi:MoaA/NifB/PqqE/SkfB family radical SAM enzyme
VTVSYELSVDLGYECPFACRFCSTSAEFGRGEMSAATIDACAAFTESLSRRVGNSVSVAVGGGEPLVCRALGPFLKVMQEHALDTILCTTAAPFINEELWRLVISNVKTARVSLHTVDRELAKDIFGPRYSLDAVLQNIARLIASGVRVEVNTLVTALNAGHIDPIVRLCTRIGVQRMRLLGLARQGRADVNWTRLKLTDAEEAIIVSGAERLASRSGLELQVAGLPGVARCSHWDEDGGCLAGVGFFHINADGEVYPCPSAKSLPQFRLGVLSPTDEFSWPDRVAPCCTAAGVLA